MRGAAFRPTQREERVYDPNELETSPLSLRRFYSRVRATPGANHFVYLIALDRIRTTICDHARELIWEMVGRVYNLRFQLDLVTNMLAIADLADFPLFLSHSTPPVYKTNCMTIKKRLPVTGVIY